jgi:hypothetical protein
VCRRGGDIDHGAAGAPVEVRSRFVEQQQRQGTDDRARQRGTALLAAGKTIAAALLQRRDTDTVQRVANLSRARAVGSLDAQREGGRSKKGCTRSKRVHAFTRSLPAGTTSIAYSGRYRAGRRVRPLAPGGYRLAAAVLPANGAATGRSLSPGAGGVTRA